MRILTLTFPLLIDLESVGEGDREAIDERELLSVGVGMRDLDGESGLLLCLRRDGSVVTVSFDCPVAVFDRVTLGDGCVG